jgi:hypothetical protein
MSMIIVINMILIYISIKIIINLASRYLKHKASLKSNQIKSDHWVKICTPIWINKKWME